MQQTMILALCKQCGARDDSPIHFPFESVESRLKWAKVHHKANNHEITFINIEPFSTTDDSQK